ncbi:MAG: hypothetical protein JST82_02065 [Bacteroidetes bacterium]|nr:hypothetical protein [Bacteroidota bacterium]
MLFSIYTAIYPLDSFYKEEFEYGFKTPFPKSGNIIAKSASYPDIHGDYTSAFVAQLNSADYKKLRMKFAGDKGYSSNDSLRVLSDSYSDVSGNVKDSQLLISYYTADAHGNRFSISFYSNNMILVHRVG